MYKLKYNFLSWIVLTFMKKIFNMTNPTGYKEGDVILLFYNGNLDLKHARELKLGLWAIMTEGIRKYNKEGKHYVVDAIGLTHIN